MDRVLGMDRVQRGWLNGFVGMLMFSGTLPATRLAMASLDPFFFTLARAALAGLIGLAVLVVRPARLPNRRDLAGLALLSAACVIAFPLLTAEALRSMSAADALVFVGLLPCMTAMAAQLHGERPARPAFWLCALGGSAVVALFAFGKGGRLHDPRGALLMLAAVAACGLGYAEGARVSRRLGGWQAIAWALILALPLTLPLAIVTQPDDWSAVAPHALAALAYVSVFSMLVGFMFWFDGLAHGGIAAVGQLQLLQPFFGLAGAALLLGEPVGWTAVLMLAGAAACAAGARRFA